MEEESDSDEAGDLEAGFSDGRCEEEEKVVQQKDDMEAERHALVLLAPHPDTARYWFSPSSSYATAQKKCEINDKTSRLQNHRGTGFGHLQSD